MRHLIIILLLISAGMSNLAHAQNCANVYFPLEDGGGYTLHHYKGNGKLLARFTHRVDSLSDEGGKKIAKVSVAGASRSGDVYFEGSYTVGCYTDVFIAGLLSWYYDPLWKKHASTAKQLSIGRVILMNESQGSILPNADLKVKLHENNFPLAVLSYQLTELKVEGTDTLSFAGADHPCLHVSYRLTTSTGPDPAYKVNHFCDAWFTDGLGVLRVEERDVKGKLVRYSEQVAP